MLYDALSGRNDALSGSGDMLSGSGDVLSGSGDVSSGSDLLTTCCQGRADGSQGPFLRTTRHLKTQHSDRHFGGR